MRNGRYHHFSQICPFPSSIIVSVCVELCQFQYPVFRWKFMVCFVDNAFSCLSSYVRFGITDISLKSNWAIWCGWPMTDTPYRNSLKKCLAFWVEKLPLLFAKCSTSLSGHTQWTPSNPATLGTCQGVLIRGVASFQEWLWTRKHIWDILKWPQHRGVLISRVQIIRGVYWF